jgi:hypothetical protein
VNLILCGHAVSNVHDGVKHLDEHTRLGGVPAVGRVGFLSLFEWYACPPRHDNSTPLLTTQGWDERERESGKGERKRRCLQTTPDATSDAIPGEHHTVVAMAGCPACRPGTAASSVGVRLQTQRGGRCVDGCPCRYQYVIVGEHYKRPTTAVWVVCCESHFTCLFAADARALTDRKPFDLFYYDGLANQVRSCPCPHASAVTLKAVCECGGGGGGGL